jgi:hypothetical protein
MRLSRYTLWFFGEGLRMPQRLHIERHFTGGEFVCDIVIGMSDGLTVPFALGLRRINGVSLSDEQNSDAES